MAAASRRRISPSSTIAGDWQLISGVARRRPGRAAHAALPGRDDERQQPGGQIQHPWVLSSVINPSGPVRIPAAIMPIACPALPTRPRAPKTRPRAPAGTASWNRVTRPVSSTTPGAPARTNSHDVEPSRGAQRRAVPDHQVDHSEGQRAAGDQSPRRAGPGQQRQGQRRRRSRRPPGCPRSSPISLEPPCRRRATNRMNRTTKIPWAISATNATARPSRTRTSPRRPRSDGRAARGAGRRRDPAGHCQPSRGCGVGVGRAAAAARPGAGRACGRSETPPPGSSPHRRPRSFAGRRRPAAARPAAPPPAGRDRC